MSDQLVKDDGRFERKNRAATDQLAVLLRQQHDYAVTCPAGFPKKIEIEVDPAVSQPIEICILPIRDALPTVDAVKRVVCRHFGISHKEIMSSRRMQKVVRPRQIAMYLCREKTTRSTPDIGRMFGGRDHTTVLHAIQKITELMLTDDRLAHDVADLEAQLS